MEKVLYDPQALPLEQLQLLVQVQVPPGDPKLMAGGISTALVTTVLGLVVAIPMTLLYAILNTRSKNIVYILQEQASGVIAERSERG